MSVFVKMSALVLLPAALFIGCGAADNTATVSPVDDSVVQTPAQMADMEAQNAADSQSQ